MLSPGAVSMGISAMSYLRPSAIHIIIGIASITFVAMGFIVFRSENRNLKDETGKWGC